MKRTVIFLLLFQSLFTFAQVNDAVLPDVWLRADSSELNATCWRDVSGHYYNGFLPGDSMPTSYTRMNFNKSYCFPEEEYLTIPGFQFNRKTLTVIIVYQGEDTLNEQALWSVALDSSSSIGLTSRRILSESGEIKYSDTNKTGGIINSLKQSWKQVSSNTFVGDVNIGFDDTLSYRGKIAEFILFNNDVPDTVLIQYMSYLAVKYGITLYQTDYLNSEKIKVWDYATHPEYSHYIAGLGRDSVLGLDQKQSLALEERMVMGVGSFAPTNEENVSIINEGDFMVWGCDSGALRKNKELFMEDGTELTVYGNCLMQVTGQSAHNQAAFMQMNTTGWDGDSSRYYLMIDRSGSGNYPLSATEFYAPDYVDTNGILYFSGIHWDSDLSGTDVFCFAYIETDSLIVERNLVAGGNGTAGSLANQPGKEGKGELENATEQSSGNSYSLYPNPNKGDFTLTVHYVKAADVTVKILTSEGKILRVMEGKEQQDYEFEGHVSVKGHYLIEVQSTVETKSFKMIVQ